MNLVPYQKKSKVLFVNMSGYTGYMRQWFPHAERVYTERANQLVKRIEKYQPDALVWHMQNKAITFRQVSGIRPTFPTLPILVMTNGIEIHQLPFTESCKCSTIDIAGLDHNLIGCGLQLAVDIAHQLVSDND